MLKIQPKLKNYVIENIKSTQDFDGLVVELAWEISKILSFEIPYLFFYFLLIMCGIIKFSYTLLY